MQRILQPGDIEALDRIEFPRVRLPRPAVLFADRAARLRALAAEAHPLREFLRFTALLVEAQAQAAQGVRTAPVDAARVERAVANAMPVVSAAEAVDPAWRDVLRALAAAVAGDPTLPRPLRVATRELMSAPADELDRRARAALRRDDGPRVRIDQPLVMAALQVVFADLASRLDERRIPFAVPATICPVCASLPVAGVLRIGGAAGGHRYLHCGTCATEWHMVRVKCSHCESTKGIRYRGIEGAGTVLAETCDTCHAYLKQVDQEEDALAEPLADDLASLTLDLLMADTPYARACANPLLALGPEDGA